MREIKFRGKSKRTGEWLYGDVLRNTEGVFAVVPPFEINCHNECSTKEVDEKTIGQFTGLHDCNGKEIYEGDIVMTHVIFAYNHEEIREFWRVGEIRFIAGGFNLTNCTNYYTRSMKGKSDIQPNPKSKFDFPAYRTQLIGNIHENPELLKGGEE